MQNSTLWSLIDGGLNEREGGGRKIFENLRKGKGQKDIANKAISE